MITKAESVMAALDVNYIPANCCVICREEWMNFVAAAINPRGERKGVCCRCGGNVSDDLFARRPHLEIVNRIRDGYYD